MIHETGFDDTFYYFGNERQIRDWPIVREFFFIQEMAVWLYLYLYSYLSHN